MNLGDKNDLLKNDTFKDRVRIATLQEAWYKLQFPEETDLLVQKYAARIRQANNLFGKWVDDVVFLLVEMEDTNGNNSDEQIKTKITSVFTELAKRYYSNI